jgi:hypothetical protein
LPVVSPDVPVPEIIMHGGLQFAKRCLTGCQGLASGHVHRLDLLHWHGCSSYIDAAAAPVLVVLSVPDQAMSSSGREDESYPGPSGLDHAWERASRPRLMGAIETAKMDFRMMFGDF